MATTTTDTGSDRCLEAEAAIRDALSRGDSKGALNKALLLLQARMAAERKARPDGALFTAELAGTLLAVSVQAHAHQPWRPPGCPKKPRPHDLLTAFQAALDAGTATGEET